MRAVIVFVSVLSFLALILLALTLHLTLESSPPEPGLKLNSTCKFENVTGLCKSKDSCIGYPATTKLDPCNEGDLSLLCCPNHETAVSNRPKRTPGLKAKEMCRRYAKTAIKLVESPILIRGVQYINTTDCVVGEKLIKGGKNATEREFPHMVYIAKFIVDSNGLLEVCGGSIVSPKFVLSAAHCNVTKDDGYVIFGTIRNLRVVDDYFQNHSSSISEIYTHPRYNASNNNNDIALYKLEITLSESERPICLDTGISLFNKMLIATGFGTNEEQKPSEVLQKVSLNIVDPGSCAAKYKQHIKDLPEHYGCTYAEGKDACYGDSGGPIQVSHGEHQCMYTLIGVISFGNNCSYNTNIPGVYTKVSNYIEWIEDIVWPA